MTNPILLFNELYKKELNSSLLKLPSACCLSTIGLDGYPNSRFVSLKEVANNRLIITGALNSRKGAEICENNKVSLAFWWEKSLLQIRMQGDVHLLEDSLSQKYFKARSRASQIVSLVCNQGDILNDIDQLELEVKLKTRAFKGKAIPMPENWKAFSINPLRIEFMKFKTTRFHHRDVYVKKGPHWIDTKLQP